MTVWEKILLYAIEKNDLDVLKEAIKQEVDIQFDYNLAFRTALNYKSVEMLIAVLDAGADINIDMSNERNSLCYSYDPLTYAACENNIEIAKVLLDYSIDASKDNKCVLKACERNNEKLVQLLLEHGAPADVNLEYFVRYIGSSDKDKSKKEISIINSLLQYNNDLINEVKNSIDVLDVIIKNDFDLMHQLLDSGINTKRDKDFDYSKLLNSSACSELELFKRFHTLAENNIKLKPEHYLDLFKQALKNKKYDIFYYISENIFPIKNLISQELDTLQYELTHGSPEVIEYVMEGNKNVDAENLLFYAFSWRCETENVKAIIEKGKLNINKPISSNSNRRNYPVIVAVENDRIDAIKMMADMGADLNVNNGEFLKTAIRRIAKDYNDYASETLDFISDGNINIKKGGTQAMLSAVEEGDLEMVKWLHERGVNFCNNNFIVVQKAKELGSGYQNHFKEFFINNIEIATPTQMRNLEKAFSADEISQIKKILLNANQAMQTEQDVTSHQYDDSLSL